MNYNILQIFGITQAIRWNLLRQLLRILTGPVTLLLIVRYLNIEAQGYFYTFASVIGISIFLELGFSQNILQFASHEFSKLSFNSNKELHGDANAYSRLVSLGRLAFKYYGIATLIFLFLLLVGGSWFFSTSKQVGVNWFGPWILVSVSSALSMAINPCWSILEGCNEISEIERFRFFSTLIGFFATSAGLVLGAGLYAVCLSSVVTMLLSILYLIYRWKNFFKMFLIQPRNEMISWVDEIWPFQWRIAVSWMCGYFIFTIITPIVFRVLGPEAAGRVGFTLQLTGLVGTMASSWSTTRLPEYGILVAKKDWAKLSEIWQRATWMSFSVACFGCITMLFAMQIVIKLIPNLELRYGGFVVALFFSISVAVQSLTSSLAFYLRAYKREPFVWLSVANAILSFSLILIFVHKWNINGAAFAYMLATVIIFPFAYKIYIKSKNIYQNNTAQ